MGAKGLLEQTGIPLSVFLWKPAGNQFCPFFPEENEKDPTQRDRASNRSHEGNAA